MDLKSAYDLLGVPEDVSDEELKKAYRAKAKAHHPDLTKDEETFKKINQAHQLICDYRANPHKYASPQENSGFWNNVVDLGSVIFGGGFGNSIPRQAKPITIDLSISFSECVKGCDRPIEYVRNAKCDVCDGEAVRRMKNDCKECNGFGQKTNQSNGMFFQSSCNKCQGANIKEEKCNSCKGKGTKEDKRSGKVHIPPGIKDGHILRMQNEGHFIGKSFMFDTYADVNVRVKVLPHKTMTVQGTNVLDVLPISLFNALKGQTLTVETVYGNKEIVIPPRSRNADQISIEGCGVNRQGKHIVMLDVSYPDDINKIIEVL